jgi:hypothetical protein
MALDDRLDPHVLEIERFEVAGLDEQTEKEPQAEEQPYLDSPHLRER